jgi:hypothetical protein
LGPTAIRDIYSSDDRCRGCVTPHRTTPLTHQRDTMAAFSLAAAPVASAQLSSRGGEKKLTKGMADRLPMLNCWRLVP